MDKDGIPAHCVRVKILNVTHNLIDTVSNSAKKQRINYPFDGRNVSLCNRFWMWFWFWFWIAWKAIEFQFKRIICFKPIRSHSHWVQAYRFEDPFSYEPDWRPLKVSNSFFDKIDIQLKIAITRLPCFSAKRMTCKSISIKKHLTKYALYRVMKM